MDLSYNDVKCSRERTDLDYKSWVHGHHNQIGELITLLEMKKWQLEELKKDI